MSDIRHTKSKQQRNIVLTEKKKFSFLRGFSPGKSVDELVHNMPTNKLVLRDTILLNEVRLGLLLTGYYLDVHFFVLFCFVLTQKK